MCLVPAASMLFDARLRDDNAPIPGIALARAVTPTFGRSSKHELAIRDKKQNTQYPLDFNCHQRLSTKSTITLPSWAFKFAQKVILSAELAHGATSCTWGWPMGPTGARGGGRFVAKLTESKWTFGLMPKELVPRPWGYRPVFGKDSGRPCGLAWLATRIGITAVIFYFRCIRGVISVVLQMARRK